METIFQRVVIAVTVTYKLARTENTCIKDIIREYVYSDKTRFCFVLDFWFTLMQML